MAPTKYNREFKIRIINDFLKGYKQSEICEKYNMEKSVISRMIKKYKLTRSVDTFHCGGRPRKTTPRVDRKIVKEFKKDPTISSREVVRLLDLSISPRTASRRGNEAGLISCKPASKPFISEKNRKARLAFAKKHISWSIQRWKSVLFSDESKFNIKGSDGMRRVRRPKNKRLDPKYYKKTVKHGGGNVMVWGCFSENTLTAVDYKNILNDIMYPYEEENMTIIWRFQHDNDPKHKSKIVKNWLELKNIRVLDWPAQSPDLNPIENLWEIVDRKLRTREYKNKSELFEAIQYEWLRVSPDYIENLITSMPRRCAEVIRNKGYATKY